MYRMYDIIAGPRLNGSLKESGESVQSVRDWFEELREAELCQHSRKENRH